MHGSVPCSCRGCVTFDQGERVLDLSWPCYVTKALVFELEYTRSSTFQLVLPFGLWQEVPFFWGGILALCLSLYPVEVVSNSSFPQLPDLTALLIQTSCLWRATPSVAATVWVAWLLEIPEHYYFLLMASCRSNRCLVLKVEKCRYCYCVGLTCYAGIVSNCWYGGNNNRRPGDSAAAAGLSGSDGDTMAMVASVAAEQRFKLYVVWRRQATGRDKQQQGDSVWWVSMMVDGR